MELKLVVGPGEGPWQPWELRLLPPRQLPPPPGLGLRARLRGRGAAGDTTLSLEWHAVRAEAQAMLHVQPHTARRQHP